MSDVVYMLLMRPHDGCVGLVFNVEKRDAAVDEETHNVLVVEVDRGAAYGLAGLGF